MTKRENQKVLNAIDSEGFDYCFIEYSDFQDVNDEEFHALRMAYVEARNRLADYIGLDEG